MTVYASVRAVGVELCERAGYDVTVTDGAGDAPAIATPTADAVGLVDAPRPIAIEPLTEATVGPEAVVPRLASALAADRDCLFVVPDPGEADAVASVIASVLRSPTALADDGPEGRQFYAGPDRVPLSDGSYACVRAPGHSLRWREVDIDDDRPRLELSAGEAVVAVFDHVDALACPDRGAFRHAYARADSGRFEVTERGEVIDSFPGVSAMRRGGYTPVSMPLVPEHLFPAESNPGRSWAVCTAREDPAVFGPDGVGDWPGQ